MKGISLKSYSHCLFGKKDRNIFHNFQFRKKNILVLTRIDICSTSDKTSGGAFYLVTYINDNSRKV